MAAIKSESYFNGITSFLDRKIVVISVLVLADVVVVRTSRPEIPDELS